MSVDVAVIGGGPAGACCAARLAELGFSVTLFEKGEGRRQHQGESLPSSIRVVLDAIGLELAPSVVVERPPEHLVYWGAMQGGRPPPAGGEPSFLVWRGRFDEALRTHARRAGVRLLAVPVHQCRRTEGGHEIDYGAGGSLACRFVVDASGRAGVIARRYRRRERGFRTLALTAHFRTDESAPPTVVEAVPDGWVWSAPLDNGLRDVTVMLDARASHASALEEAPHVQALVGDAPQVGRTRGTDATPYRASRFCDRDVVLIGDAGSFLDPLSAHGVHKAMDSGLVAAVVARTILERPQMAPAAAAFFDEREQAIYAATRERLERLYRQETRFAERPFWRKRSGVVEQSAPPQPRAPLRPDMKLRAGPGVAVREAPVLEGDFIELRRILESPEHERAVRFLGPIRLPELFDEVLRAESAAAAARAAAIPYDQAYGAIDWLYRAGYLLE